MTANRRAPSALPMKVTALDAASPASFQPLKAQTWAGARKPSGRYSHWRGCIRTTVHHGRMATDALSPMQISGLRAGQALDSLFACTRKDRLTTRSGSPYLALEFRDGSGA